MKMPPCSFLSLLVRQKFTLASKIVSGKHSMTPLQAVVEVNLNNCCGMESNHVPVTVSVYYLATSH